MHLIYFDESGNTGNNLSDDTQPIFVLCGLAVPADRWQIIENDLADARRAIYPDPIPDHFEMHGAEILSPGKACFFRGKPLQDRIALYRSWIDVAKKHSLRVFARAIVKKRYSNWLHDSFGAGVSINPHIAAFALLSQVVNQHLASLSPPSLGILISDENKEVVKDIEKSIRALRFDEGALRLSHIIEKGFFIESHKSLLLQLCDLCTYSVRKNEEAKIGRPMSGPMQTIAALADPLIHKDNEAMPDVLAWLQGWYQSGAARGNATGTKKGSNHTSR
jgi:hypothetical protein